MDELTEFQQWSESFDMRDDGVAAFKAVKALDAIRFELATRSDGWVERVERMAEDAK